MTFTTPHPVDQSLSGWIDAYERLKAAQNAVKSAGVKSTPSMRQEVDRLRLYAENALKHLQTDFDAARSPRANSPPGA